MKLKYYHDGYRVRDDGRQEWWSKNKLHREDGPAIIWEDGICTWIINHQRYDFEDYCAKLNLADEDILMLKLKYAC